MIVRRTIAVILACVMLSALQGALFESWAEDAGKQWVSRVISVQGHVLVKRHGELEWQPVKLEDTLFAGDQIRVDTNSRAGIVLSNDAVLRLDQNTSMVFTEIEQPTTFIFKLLKGAGNFFSHMPHSLKIVTPFVNGVVEGTEFYVQVDGQQTRIDLFEGRILAQNAYGELQLDKDQEVIARAGQAPQARILVHPRDSVQWALYYPPVLTVGPDKVPAGFGESIALYNQGRPAEALDRMAAVAQKDRNARYYILRAGLLLNVGRVNQAREDIRQALAQEVANPEALALQAVIAVVQNRKNDALDIARKAVQSNVQSAAAQIALSYAHQAAFKLPEACQDARAAASNAPENGTAWARLAELQLSIGELDLAVTSAQKAAALNPSIAHAHTILGFAYLTRIKTRKARKAFNQAIALDSSAPLPRLGLGLAKIRDGDLEEGRAQIEIAAGLDPGNALIRSYLGKAYFDEKRDPLDEQQFEIAKSLDPKDPTPWFYDAIRKQTINRPVEALEDLDKSIQRNDNRAVYRSRLLLDEDLAARSAGLARIYDDLGFSKQLALSEGCKAVNINYSEFSSHRFLADSYAKLSRHEIARVSELLQSKLLQPLNVTPIQLRQSEYGLLIPEGIGPASTSFNEFNPLFASDGIKAQASATVGSNRTLGDDLAILGLYKNLSINVGQLHYETDGFRENNDLSYNIYDAFVQAALSTEVNLQLELQSRKTDRGDLRMLFDPDFFAPDKRTEDDQKSLRIGGNLRLGPQKNLIVSLIHSDLDRHITDRSETSDAFYQLTTDQDIAADTEANSGEVQYLNQADKYTMIAGIGHIDQDQKENSTFTITTEFPPLPPSTDTTSVSEYTDDDHSNAYLYTNLRFVENLTLTVGASYNTYKVEGEREEKIACKSGLVWSPRNEISFRAAWFQNTKRPFAANETIEPTQIAGFNQFFDDFDGSETQRYGAAIDAKILTQIHGGAEFTWRFIDVPSYAITTSETTIKDQKEKAHRAYLNWVPVDNLALSLEAFFEEFNDSTTTIKQLTTFRYPFGISYHLPCGVYASTLVTAVSQELTSDEDRQRDNFTVVDLSIGYRFPKRYGSITFGAKNLFDEQFHYQDYNFNTDEPLTPLYVPECLLFAQITLYL